MSDYKLPDDDRTLFKEIRSHLFSAVIGDVLDVMGYDNQFLPAQIQPLDNAMMLVGRAVTIHESKLPKDKKNANINPFGAMFEALDSLGPDSVYVCSGCPDADFAMWGELMTIRARHLGAAGAVIDGFSRDTKGILKLGFPTFSRGRYARDQGIRGYVTGFGDALTFNNGVRVEQGDLIVGDLDGVLVIPQKVERKTLQAAIEKVLGEDEVRQAIEDGMGTAEAFRTFGIM